VSDLALAAFAAETGSHLVAAPRTERYARFRREFDETAYRARLAERALRFIGRSAAEFPVLLRAIHDPPAGLFLRSGASLQILGDHAVAVVGARACSTYGSHVARALARDLAAAGVVVVSGMARGVDGEAHRGALEAGGITVAALGCGIDCDYPAAHAQLARTICERGLVVSEYPPGVEPAPWRFPARNRIIAGLVSAVVVVEARERSGALITADLALEEGREVFAVPGEITSSLSAGSNELLRLGAHVLTSAADVLDVLGIAPRPPIPEPELDPKPRRVFEALSDAPASADELARTTGLPAADVAPALSHLELAGLIAEGEGLYRVVRPTG
jgi:DNA processing protein